ncbi:MAG TPA: tyrosine-type recombinase/integrase, partial [Terriglobales bacterium]|nr:tyrosine-type recombinase/integrase [Terriglobales bacterium]
MPTNAELISRFGSFMRSERGLSENTIDSYVRDVRKLAEWFTKPLPEIQCTDITRHLASRRDAGSDGRSNYRFLASFRCFFGFLIDDEEIAHDPTIGVPRPRYTKPLPDVARHQDIETMIASLGDSWLDIRDRAMLYLFFGSGLRESELAALRLSDIDLNQALVKIWGGKGGKDAVLPISGAAVEALRRYLTDVRPKIAEFGFGARLSANPSHVTRWRWAQQAKNPKPRPASPFLFLGQR